MDHDLGTVKDAAVFLHPDDALERLNHLEIDEIDADRWVAALEPSLQMENVREGLVDGDVFRFRALLRARLRLLAG